ncbi:MAG: hypothetical protein NUV55_03295 [Sulfuricaulis sp.]|uniref:hypothetical protein n=1 Tax=Sulfuricaulis sp. TaxID=2003553 RepID=UPI0025F3B57A|nr:hypothetical protein [Sulfuricaulis sp.]MCR4346222.1 hypothetical protein [Sulfuricaulis sp.]
MKGIQFKSWLTRRHRKSIALALAGWMSLSLVLAFWSCCHTLADEHPPVVSMQSGDHNHGGIPHGTEDPCRTWLDTSDVALNTSPDVLVSDFKLKFGHAVFVDSQIFSAVVLSVPDRQLYHASPPDSLPLYLRLQHLLI